MVQFSWNLIRILNYYELLYSGDEFEGYIKRISCYITYTIFTYFLYNTLGIYNKGYGDVKKTKEA